MYKIKARLFDNLYSIKVNIFNIIIFIGSILEFIRHYMYIQRDGIYSTYLKKFIVSDEISLSILNILFMVYYLTGYFYKPSKKLFFCYLIIAVSSLIINGGEYSLFKFYTIFYMNLVLSIIILIDLFIRVKKGEVIVKLEKVK